MKKDIGLGKILKTSLGISLAICISISSANAAETVAKLSGIEINPTNNGSYDIVLNTDKNVEYKKTVTAEDKIEIDIQGAEASKSLGTIYNNAIGIDHVMFKPLSGDHVKIFLKGAGIASSKVSLNSNILPPDVLNKASSEDVLVLNQPMDTYKSVTPVEEVDSKGSLYESVLSSLSPRKILDSTNLGWIMSFALLTAFLITAATSFREKNKVNIKIKEDLKLREQALYAQMNRNKDLIGQELGLSRSNEIQPGAAPKQAYGIRAYENSQINPLKTNSRARMSLNSGNTGINAVKRPVQPSTLQSSKKRTVNTRTAPRTATMAASKRDIQQAQVHIDSIKFLESMAQIYEKSGQVDLANGLQSNIRKARTVR